MNPFQSQYPLSPKKFWKKFLPTIIPTIIFGIIIGGTIAVFLPFLFNAQVSSFQSLIPQIILQGTGLALLITVCILVMYAWYFSSYIRTYFYQGDDNFITIRKGVFTPREIHVQYQKIQDVYVDQDLFDRILGLYDVHIASATATSGMEAHIDGVEQDVAEGLKNFFLQKMQSPVTVSPTVVPGAAPLAATVPAGPIQLSQEISNKTYPFDGRFVFTQFLGALLLSPVIGVFLTFAFVPRNGGTFSFASYVPGGYIMIFVVGTIAYFIIHFISALIWDANYRFAFMPEYIQLNTGVISRSERHLPYKSIQDVNVSQNILASMLGIANVTIENAAQIGASQRARQSSGITLVGLSPQKAAEIVEIVKGIMTHTNSSQMGL
jgi:uncharacterized membrane protein YdbT with pleckstrin-like domain